MGSQVLLLLVVVWESHLRTTVLKSYCPGRCQVGQCLPQQGCVLVCMGLATWLVTCLFFGGSAVQWCTHSRLSWELRCPEIFCFPGRCFHGCCLSSDSHSGRRLLFPIFGHSFSSVHHPPFIPVLPSSLSGSWLPKEVILVSLNFEPWFLRFV